MNSTEACLSLGQIAGLPLMAAEYSPTGEEGGNTTMQTPITASQAIELMQEFSDETTKVDLDYLRERGFEIVSDVVAGSANVQAAPVVNEELVALIEQVKAAGRSKDAKGKPLSTSTGKPKTILGKTEHIGGYTVIINGTR